MLSVVSKAMNTFYFLRSEDGLHPTPLPPRPQADDTSPLDVKRAAYRSFLYDGDGITRSQGLRAPRRLPIIQHVCVASGLFVRLITGQDDPGVAWPPDENLPKTDNFHPHNRFAFGS